MEVCFAMIAVMKQRKIVDGVLILHGNIGSRSYTNFVMLI